MRDNSKKADEKGIDIHLNFHLNPSLKSSKTIENLNLISGKQLKTKKHKYIKRRVSQKWSKLKPGEGSTSQSSRGDTLSASRG